MRLVLPLAFFIAHGFLDEVKSFSSYIGCAVAYAGLVRVFAFPFMLIFVLFSMHHFGRDFGTPSIGAVLFGASAVTRWGHLTWRRTLLWLGVRRADLFVSCVLIAAIFGVCRSPWGVPLFIALCVGFGGPRCVFLWACCAHAPLTVFAKKRGVVIHACLLGITSCIDIILRRLKLTDFSTPALKTVAHAAIGVAVAHMLTTELNV